MPEQSRIVMMKQFFSIPGRPVTNQELMEFRKTDPAGFDEIANLVVVEMARTAPAQATA